jgi:hypothetical protein
MRELKGHELRAMLFVAPQLLVARHNASKSLCWRLIRDCCRESGTPPTIRQA